jgi:hypothetical protein
MNSSTEVATKNNVEDGGYKNKDNNKVGWRREQGDSKGGSNQVKKNEKYEGDEKTKYDSKESA